MRRASLLFAFLLAALALPAACGGTATSISDADASPDAASANAPDASSADSSSPDASTDAAKITTHAPAVHRPAPVSCTHTRGAGDFDVTLQFAACKSDAECINGDNGRCLSSKGGAQTNTCSYDTCFDDSACSGKVCTCRESPASNAANRCSAGNCTIDANCGAGGYCSPSVDPDKTNYGITGWWCHTRKDTCADDADCTSSTNTNAKCAYDPSSAHWACSSTLFLPP
ncbi:MAG: hypothetical protein JWP87_460 [Labilithrix sp.]|nr:hypothetical protein [Labilithrix sp.]